MRAARQQQGKGARHSYVKSLCRDSPSSSIRLTRQPGDRPGRTCRRVARASRNGCAHDCGAGVSRRADRRRLDA
eukprot:2636552-Prymnesium_polylepis.1